jgi:tetratricopeptide (TPR) repeat protein
MIIRGTERIDVLKGKQRFTVLRREQMLERAFMSGQLSATMSVEGLRVGDVLYMSYSITQKDPVFKGGLQTVMPILPEQIRVGFGRVRLLWPSGMDLRWRAYAKDPVVQTSEANGYRELNLALPLPKQPEIPGDAPMRYQRPPILEATNFTGWGAVVANMAPLYRTEGTIKPGSPLAAEVAKIAAATTDPRLRTAMALQLVQDKVRYLFRGMDDGNYVPQTPALTWEVRYGDCKAKTLILVAMLRALGIDAEAALTSMSAGDLLPQRLPMPGAFDHVIARVTIGSETLWLDGTANDARLADLGDVPQFRYALPLHEGVTELVPLPVRANARPDADVTIEIDQRAGIGFTAPFTVTAKMRGGMTGMLRMASGSLGAEQLDNMIDASLAPYVFGGTIIERSMAYDEANGLTTFTASGFVDMAWAADGDNFKVPLDTLLGDMSFTPDRARAAWKEIPVSTGELSNKRVRVILRLPNDGLGFKLEGDQTLPPAMAGMQLSRTTSLTGGVVTIEDRVITGAGEIAPADIPAARQQVARAKTRVLKASAPADYPATWQVVEDARAAKAFDPLLALYARRIALKPDEVDSYMYRATFLTGIYDRKGALADWDKAIELAPTAELYVIRADARFALGDDAGAIADARAALELDPGSVGAVRTLANTLAATGKLDEALALVGERVDVGGKDKNSFVMLQAQLLGQNGRAAEGIALLDAAIAEKPRDEALLNSRCWVKGTANVDLEGALKDCNLSIQLSDTPANVIDSRGMVFYRMGKFELAKSDFAEAIQQNPYLAGSYFMRGVIRRQQGDQYGSEDLDAARMIDPQIGREYARYGIKP